MAKVTRQAPGWVDVATSWKSFCDHFCSGLNENGHCRLIYLNTWSPVGGTVRRFRRCGHVEGGISLGTDFKDFKKIHTIPSGLSLLPACQDLSFPMFYSLAFALPSWILNF